MGYLNESRYGIWVIDLGYGMSRYGYLPYRYGHPGYRHGIWANDMGVDSIDIVICHIDMGYLDTPSIMTRVESAYGSSA
jgi:hypothetical protein